MSHKPTGQEVLTLTCPTYDGPWSWADTFTVCAVVLAFVVVIVGCTWIYWHHNGKPRRA